jgi:hypothetical protein
MGDRDIDEQQPKHGEQQHGGEPHPLHKCAHDQRWRDNGECHLEHEKDSLGILGVSGNGRPRNAEQEGFIEIADPRTRPTECKTISADQLKHRNKTGNGEAVHEHRQHVFGPH